MIDTHSHLDSDTFDADRNEVIKNAFDAGVEYIIIPAIKESGFENLFELVNTEDRLFCAMGVHPHHSKEYNQIGRAHV